MIKEEKKPELFTIPAEASWHLERVLKPDDKKIGNYVLIQPGAPDIAKVVKAYSHHAVKAYNIASIEIVYNEQLNRLFYAQMTMMNARKGNIKYTPAWKTKSSGQEKQQREATHQQLEKFAAPWHDTSVPHIKLLPLWHGTNDDIANNYIFNMGYGIFTSNDPTVVTDEGYFGKGVYTAHEAEYAFRSYAKKHGDKAVLLLNWVSSFEAYPVIDGDMDKLRGKMGGYDQCDAHFIPVYSDLHPNTDIYVPCQVDQNAQYHEMVVFTASQCLPRYRVKLLENFPKHSIDATATMAYQMGLDCFGLGQYGMVVNAFEGAQDAGHPAASIRLHWLHSGASGVMPANKAELQKYAIVPKSSIDMLKDKANLLGESDSESQFILGWCYQHGLGVDKNPAEAAKYYWIAAHQGHRDAQYQLGVCCSRGMGVKQEMKQAIFYYEQAAAQGHVHANYVLFQCYEWGLGVEPDPIKAASFKLAAQQGQHPQLANSGLAMSKQLLSNPQPIANNTEDKKRIAQLEAELKKQKDNREQDKRKINELTQASQIKDQTITSQSIQLKSKEDELQRQQQAFTAQHQQLQFKEQQLKEELHRQEEKAAYLTQVLNQKESELKMTKADKGDLEKALQEALDAQYMLNLQIQEYQKQLEKAKQAQVAQPKAPSGTSSFFQGNTPPKSQPVRDEKNLNLLLKWVVEGHLEEVEKLLKSKPELALMEGNIKDLSGREFKGITALQYAHWALDAEMMEVIVKYTDKVEVLNQLKSFESNPAKYSAHGLHYDNSVLLQKMTECLNNYSKWSEEQRASYWQKEIGGAQRMCPAWLVYAMCEGGADVAWTKKDEKRKVKRQYEKEHLRSWFAQDYNGGKLGEKWAAYRGVGSELERSTRGAPVRGLAKTHYIRKPVECLHDHEVHGKLRSHRAKVVEDLKTQLTATNYSRGKVG